MYTREKAVKLILSAETLHEAFFLFCRHRELLKNCRFLFFKDKVISMPSIVNSEYTDDSGRGYAVYTLSCSNNLFVLDEKRVTEMLRGKDSQIRIGICVDFDTQILTDLKAYYEDKTKCSKSLVNLLTDLDKYKCDYTCLPYILENGGKLPNDEILAGMIKSLEIYFHYKENTLVDFGAKLPFSNQTYSETHKTLNPIQSGAQNHYIVPLITVQKAIYCTLLKCAIISLCCRTLSAKKKMLMLLDFVNNQLGVCLERELTLCYFHFKKDNSVERFFKKIQPNAKEIKKTVQGMAWDLWHLRMLEFSTAMDAFDSDQFFIHTLLTRDFGLQDVMRKVPLQCLAIIKSESSDMPTYMSRYEPPLFEVAKNDIDIESEVFEKESVRRATHSRVDYEELIQSLEKELCESIK